jgi:tetratricopeptide (TPR) repeat protein
MAREMVNYAALLNERKEYTDAIAFLDAAIERYGWDDWFGDIYAILNHNSAVALIHAGKPWEAIDFIDSAAVTGRMKEASAKELRGQAAEQILANDLPPLAFEDGLALVDNLLEEGLLTPQRHQDFAVMLYAKSAEEQARGGRYLAASQVINGAIKELGADSRLLRARDAYRYNYSVEAHNAFASLFNRKKYIEAQDHVLKALEQVPESDILAEDLAMVRRVLASDE